MNKVLSGLDFTHAYLDDGIIFSKTVEKYIKHIQIVLTRLKQASFKLKKGKCAFFKRELYYLGHVPTTDGIKPQTKIKAIYEMKPPTNQKYVGDFLGMVGYYRHFISRFADATRPMTKLIRKDKKFEWPDDC